MMFIAFLLLYLCKDSGLKRKRRKDFTESCEGFTEYAGQQSLSDSTVTQKSELIFGEHHFIYKVSGTGDLVDNEQDVADIEADIPAIVGVEYYVAHRPFPDTVEIYAHKVALGIDYRAS